MRVLSRKKRIYQRITIDKAKARLRDDTRQPHWDELDPYILPIVEVRLHRK